MMSELPHGAPRVWDVREQGDEATLVLKGEISERTSLDVIAAQLPGTGPLTIDTYGIKRVNSVGVREWVNFLRSLKHRASITLICCSPAMVAQLNSVFNFRAHATIKSVAAPYFCAQCDSEQLEVIVLPGRFGSPSELVSGTHTCNKCGGVLDFDDLPDRYFVFLQNTGFFEAVS